VQPEVLVPDVRRVRSAAERPRRESPHAHVIGRRGENSAYKEVHATHQKGGANPALNTLRFGPRVPRRDGHR